MITVEHHTLIEPSAGREYLIEVKLDGRLVVSSWGFNQKERAAHIVNQLESLLDTVRQELLDRGLL